MKPRLFYGSVSGIAPVWLDTLMMRFAEIFLSVPSLLLVLFVQAILGDANVRTLSIVSGVTSWAEGADANACALTMFFCRCSYCWIAPPIPAGFL